MISDVMAIFVIGGWGSRTRGLVSVVSELRQLFTQASPFTVNVESLTMSIFKYFKKLSDQEDSR